MALIKRMKEGDKSPTLYSWYDKKYDFDQLQRDADEGVHEYITSLKRGSKDIDQFMKAYYDIMTGIRDGSITFKDGRYVDSRGRYSNGLYYDNEGVKQTSKRSSKDYYGLMANYIYGKQRSQNEYTAPEDKTKIKWAGSSSIGKAITRNIFNSDTWNNKDFQDLNEYDESGKVKGTDNRYKKLRDAFDYVLRNFDNLFSGYSEQDKVNATKYISEAMRYLEDGKIDPGDYLALNKAASGLDYRGMFSTQSENPEVPTRVPAEGQQEAQTLGFVDWAQRNYPQFSGTLHNPLNLNINKTLGDYTLTKFKEAISKLSENDLYRMIRFLITDANYVFNNEPFIRRTFAQNPQIPNQFGLTEILKNMEARKLLQPFGQDNPNLYYIPMTDTNRQTAWVWDTKDNSVKEMSFHNIPYWRNRIQQEYNNYANSGNRTSLTGFEQFLRQAGYQFKKGGILKAQNGDKLWYSNLATNGDYDPTKYTYSYDTSRLVNADMTDDNFDPWVSNVAGKGVGRYLPAEGNKRKYTQGIENTKYYQDFKKALLNSDGTFTDLGLAWAKATDALLPKGSKATFFDENGKLRESWSVNNKDIYERAPQSFNKLDEYVNQVMFDQILGSRHNVFLNTGKRYFYKDQNGNKHWVDPNSIEGYTVSETPESSWNDDHTVYWNDYELTGLKTPAGPKDEKDEKDSFIDPRSQSTKSPNQFGNFLSQLAPDLIGAGRLFGSLRTNNKVAETIRKSLTPVLKNTYELYSPVTGAFSEMQLRNSQAADVRRQVARPFTSDASLQLAGALEANRQATDLERQGFLADDAEIKRTKAEALRRQEDNIARRSEVANFNRASVNQTNRELAQLEGARLKQNWQSVDNFLAGLEGRVRQRLEADKERKTNFRLQTAQQDINDQYQEAVQKAQDAASKWKKDPANTSKTLSEMPNYFPFLRELSRWRNANSLGAHANVYGYKYNNDYLNKSARDIGSKYGFYRNGGSLRPSILHMINKILRNENNT